MSSDKRRQARTQGKFCDSAQQSDSTKKGKSGKRGKEKNGSAEDCKGKLQTKGEIDQVDFRDSTEQEPGHMVQEENLKVTYVENSSYDLPIPEPRKVSVEIKERGMKVLSKTENGESRILYYPSFLYLPESFLVFDDLNNTIKWHQVNVVIHGREFLQPRLVAWFGPFPYGYSGVHLEPQEMSNNILEIKKKVEDFLATNGVQVEFNSVLLNLYKHGKHSVAWHSDDELSMGIHPTIASVSVGAVRKFEMRRKPTASNPEPPTEYFVNMKNGSLLVMDGVMQTDWQHRVPKEPGNDIAPRINLTFRKVHKVERSL